MKVAQVINCSFDRWYNEFKNLTFKSEIIPITNDVLEYLKSDSTIILPKSCQESLDTDLKSNQFSDDDTDSTDWTETDDDTVKTEYLDFPEFDKQINSALLKFRNKVLIKLNWSSPKDAYWALNKLSCDRLSDVYIQLKSSDFINHDLTGAFDECEDIETNQDLINNFKYSLVIRDWISFNSSMEFRCFVHNNILIGISQRDCRSFFEVLIQQRNDILNRVRDFYIQNIHGKFPDTSYVFDVCSGKSKIKLIDFNPFGKTTDSLLYSWDELNDDEFAKSNDSMTSVNLEFRIVEDNYGISSNQYSMYAQPKESLEAFLSGKQGNVEAENLSNLIKENINIQNKEEESAENLETIEK